MKKKLDLIGFVGAILLIIAFVITLSITFLCDIDLSKWSSIAMAGSIIFPMICFSFSEE